MRFFTRIMVLVSLCLAVACGFSFPAIAAQMPPQLPSAEDLDRLQAQMSSSLTKVRSAQSELDRVVQGYQTARSRSEDLDAEISEAEKGQMVLEAQMVDTRRLINGRASETYRAGPAQLLNVLMDARSYREFSIVVDLLEAVTSRDSEHLVNLSALKDQVSKVRSDLEVKRAEQKSLVEQLKRRQSDMQRSLAALGRQYETVRAQLDDRKSGFVFPVRAPYSYVDTWGGARSGGRKHQGVDIFAVRGTPVYAVVNGMIEQMAVNPLGGNKLWVRSPGDNWSYYYAHLNAYAPGIRDGVRVKKGQLLGYVGTTGNAVGTPPHLHFQTQAPKGATVNPYPILKRVNPIK
jgi:murein DD-endopeptidase MepM/ murein hydrolase activator NlpD